MFVCKYCQQTIHSDDYFIVTYHFIHNDCFIARKALYLKELLTKTKLLIVQ